MSKANQLRAKQRAYYSLLENVSSFNSKLKTAYNQLENAVKTKQNFLIDDESADNNDIENSREAILKTSEKLTSTIIPAIQNKINNLNKDISNAEAEG
jgi:hypothetical protein